MSIISALTVGGERTSGESIRTQNGKVKYTKQHQKFHLIQLNVIILPHLNSTSYGCDVIVQHCQNIIGTFGS
jgi:hypothetical protein